MSHRFFLQIVFATALLSVPLVFWDAPFGLRWIGIILLPSSLILIPILGWAAWNEARLGRELRKTGVAWAHWKFGGEDIEGWIAFAQIEWARTRSKIWIMPLILFLLPALPITVAALAGHILIRSFSIPLLVALAVALVAGVCAWVSGKRRFERRLVDPGEVFFGADGIFYEDRYQPLRGLLVTFKARVKTGSPCVLTFELTDRRIKHKARREIRIFVPRGRVEEAFEVASRYNRS